MGEGKEISSAAALAGGVETLRAGLASFESSTGQMKSIFQDFEGRLGKLESEMLPMKDINTKLTIARRNITSAISRVRVCCCCCYCSIKQESLLLYYCMYMCRERVTTTAGFVSVRRSVRKGQQSSPVPFVVRRHNRNNTIIGVVLSCFISGIPTSPPLP